MTADISENLKAIYTLCFFDRLELSIRKIWKMQSVSNIIVKIKELLYFFNFSERRQPFLLECIETFAPNADKRNWRMSVEPAGLNE